MYRFPFSSNHLRARFASRHEDASCSACPPKLRFPLLRLRSKRTRPRLRMRTLKRRQSCGVLMRRLSASSEQLHMPQVPLKTLHSLGFETLGDASATYASSMPNAQTERFVCLARKVPPRSGEKALSVTSIRIRSSASLGSFMVINKVGRINDTV